MNDNRNIELSEAQTRKLDIDVLGKVTGGSGLEIAQFLDGKTVVISAKSNGLGILLEPVTAKTLADAVNNQYGVSVSEQRIVLNGDIRTIGTHIFQVNAAVRAVAKMKALVK